MARVSIETLISFIDAVSKGSADEMRRGLAAGISPNCIVDGWYYPLAAAAINGRTDLVGELLSAGAKVNGVSPRGDTPLMSAAAHGNVEMMRILLDAGADVHRVDEEGRTALWFADGKPECEALLHQRGLHSKEGELTPELKKRIEQQTKKAIAKNIRSEATKDPQHLAELLQEAITADLPKEVVFLIRRGAIVDYREDEEEWTALAWAADRGYLDVLKAALEAGAEVDLEVRRPGFQGTALMFAADAGRLECVRFLVQAGANPAATGFVEKHQGPAALFAAARGHREVAEYLLPLTYPGKNVTVDDLLRKGAP